MDIFFSFSINYFIMLSLCTFKINCLSKMFVVGITFSYKINTYLCEYDKHILIYLTARIHSGIVNCCGCCLPSETYGINGVTPIVHIFKELPVPPQVAGAIESLNCILSTRVRFWT